MNLDKLEEAFTISNQIDELQFTLYPIVWELIESVDEWKPTLQEAKFLHSCAISLGELEVERRTESILAAIERENDHA